MLSDPKIMENQNRFRELSKEFAELEPIANCFKRHKKNEEALADAKLLLEEGDSEMKGLAQEEIKSLEANQLLF